MRIGIVTFHYALNAGAILQAYALQSCLNDMGHEVEFINIKCSAKFNFRRYLAKSPKTTLNKLIDNLNGWYYSRFKDWNWCLKKSLIHYPTYDKLKNNPPDYDVYIVGSDQVWNFIRELNPLYLLEFVPNEKKRIAYAASMGQCNVPKHLYTALRKALVNFHAISIREDSGVNFINSLMGCQIACKAIDPTLLINKAIYNKISIRPKEQEPFIVSYLLSLLDDKQCRNIVEWSKRQGKKLINLRNPSTCIRLPNSFNKIVTPYEWLGYMSNTEFVVCGSFHAVVFALIFHKPFIVIIPRNLKNGVGNVRINSLLEPIGLHYRILYDNDIYVMEDVVQHKIDWKFVDACMESQRYRSIHFLKNSIL